MANQTLTGCIDFGSGLAKFDQDDCEYSGCMVIGGVHDKQVAVTINTSFCDDIYYGCVVFLGGTFQVVVPDDCCVDPCTASVCCRCWGCSSEKTPTAKEITFAGISDCPGKNGSSLNGVHILLLDQSDFSCDCVGDPACIFSKEVTELLTIETIIDNLALTRFVVTGKVWTGSAFRSAFRGVVSDAGGICEDYKNGSVANSFTISCFLPTEGYGGTATWTTDGDLCNE